MRRLQEGKGAFGASFQPQTLSGFVGHVLDCLAQLAIGALEVFGHDLHVGQYRHKVGVAAPARHDMKMHMLGNSSPRRLPFVNAHVKALGIHRPMKGSQAKLRGLHNIGERGRI